MSLAVQAADAEFPATASRRWVPGAGFPAWAGTLNAVCNYPGKRSLGCDEYIL